LNAIAENPDALRFSPRIWIRTRGQSRGQFLVVSVDDIDWIEAQARYSCAHTREGDHPLLESISQIEARLDPSRFARVHRSVIINLDRVIEVPAFLFPDCASDSCSTSSASSADGLESDQKS
jgi:DNA-binding LytR/AlgR family response regulator